MNPTTLSRWIQTTTHNYNLTHLQTVTTTNISNHLSLHTTTTAAWTPWLSSSNIEKLERTQLQAARAITHHVRSTPTEAVLYEADLPWLEHRFKTLSVLQANKWNSLDVEDPRRVVLNDSVRQRLRQPDWRTTVLAALSSLGLLPYHPGFTHHPDLTHLGAVHHQLPRRCFQVDVKGPAVSGYTGCHRRHRPN